MSAKYLSEEVKNRLRHIQTGDAATDLTRFPDFLITGPQRTASTWLYYSLKRHPQIFLPTQKEVFYFSTLGQPDHNKFRYPLLEDYLEVMDEPWTMRMKKCTRSLITMQERYSPKKIGEVTPSYAALDREVIEEIVSINPEIRTIIMLRHPMERAVSHATKDLVRSTNKDVTEVPFESWERFFSTRGQLKLARYQTMIKNWTAHLQPGNLFLGDFRQVQEDPIELLTAIHKFLGVRSGEKYCQKTTRRQINANPEVALADDVTAYLQELLADEISEYEELVSKLRAGHAVY